MKPGAQGSITFTMKCLFQSPLICSKMFDGNTKNKTSKQLTSLSKSLNKIN